MADASMTTEERQALEATLERVAEKVVFFIRDFLLGEQAIEIRTEPLGDGLGTKTTVSVRKPA